MLKKAASWQGLKVLSLSFSSKMTKIDFMNDDDIARLAAKLTINLASKEDMANMEQRITSRFDMELGKIRAEIVNSEKRVLSEMGNFVNDQLLPQLDEQDERIAKIESLPTVAHGLSLQKSH